MSGHAISQLLSVTLYYRRFFPYYAFCMVGSLDDDGIYFVTDKDFAKGFEVMAEKYPWHFNNFMNDNEDAETADVWFQCIVFGEIVYG